MMPLPDRTFGRYQLREQLASGPRAVVFRALDPIAGREVALKLFHPTSGDEVARAFVTRFFRDLEAAARLSHPNLVRIYDFGELEGRPYVAMELCEGPILAPLLRRSERPPFERAVTMVAEVARALDLAHHRDLLHGNLKPSNLIFHEGVLKVTDFAVIHLDQASPIEPEAAADALRYRAPEQLRGLQLDGRTDEFSLGILFYQLATGVYPFPGKAGLGSRAGREQPSPPRWWNPALPAEVDGVCARVLAREAVDRYPNCLAFAQTLEHLLTRQGRKGQFIPPVAPGGDEEGTLAVRRLESLEAQPAPRIEGTPGPVRPRSTLGGDELPVLAPGRMRQDEETASGGMAGDEGARLEAADEAIEVPGDEAFESTAGVIEAPGDDAFEAAVEPIEVPGDDAFEADAEAIEVPEADGFEAASELIEAAEADDRAASPMAAADEVLEETPIPAEPAPDEGMLDARPGGTNAPLPWAPRPAASRRQPVVAVPPPVEEWALQSQGERLTRQETLAFSPRRDASPVESVGELDQAIPTLPAWEAPLPGPFTPADVLPPGEDPELAALIAANQQGTAPRPPIPVKRPAPVAPPEAPARPRTRLRTLGYMLLSAAAAVGVLHFFGPEPRQAAPTVWPVEKPLPASGPASSSQQGSAGQMPEPGTIPAPQEGRSPDLAPPGPLLGDEVPPLTDPSTLPANPTEGRLEDGMPRPASADANEPPHGTVVPAATSAGGTALQLPTAPPSSAPILTALPPGGSTP